MISNGILGVLLLFLGRKVFWLSVGIIGFLVGVDYAKTLSPQLDPWLTLLLSVVLGVLGAIGAIAFEWVAIFLMGFLGGGYFLMKVFSFILGPLTAQSGWILFTLGGIVGICVMAMAFDGALIVISSFIGAVLVVESLPMDEVFRNILFISCAVFGILVQYWTMKVSTEKVTTTTRVKYP